MEVAGGRLTDDQIVDPEFEECVLDGAWHAMDCGRVACNGRAGVQRRKQVFTHACCAPRVYARALF